MPWVRYDDRYPFKREIRKLGDSAYRLHHSAVCWSSDNGTDGFVGDDDLELASDCRDPRTAVQELVARGLWEECEDGWRIVTFYDHALSADQVERDRALKTERQQRWRQNKRGSASVDASTPPSRSASRDASKDGAPTRPDPTHIDVLRTSPEAPAGPEEPASATAAPPRAKSKPKEPNPTDETADRIVTDWWERNKSSTAQTFIAVRKIIRPLIARGIDPDLVAAAMDNATATGFPISGGTLTTAMKRLTQPQAPPQDQYGTVTPLRPSTTHVRVSAALERAARYAAEEAAQSADPFAKEA